MSIEAALFFFGILPSMIICLIVCGTGVEEQPMDHPEEHR